MMNPKRLARLLFREYSIYSIYGYSGGNAAYADEAGPLTAELRFQAVTKSEIDNSRNELIVQQAWYHGEGAHAYACLKDSEIVGLCFFWHGERYRKRNFWPLAEAEAKLVQMIVLPEMRGRGIARSLIKFATREMSRQGFKHMYARIWWSNTPSLRAFKHAGWKRIATVIEISIFRWDKPLRLKLMSMSSQGK
ncbi:GNAT family N-acetyltransferase [Nitrosospira briensis]|uniref:GNAT family N-acetyltransferase n=1 Tax=Nitrosospira briensis TaxID=35799 RepID=UPI0009453877|nr:GNAT family N-acetyltransferase [Nitrosospira briensis]